MQFVTGNISWQIMPASSWQKLPPLTSPKMKAARYSKTLVTVYHITWHCTPVKQNLKLTTLKHKTHKRFLFYQVNLSVQFWTHKLWIWESILFSIQVTYYRPYTVSDMLWLLGHLHDYQNLKIHNHFMQSLNKPMYKYSDSKINSCVYKFTKLNIYCHHDVMFKYSLPKDKWSDFCNKFHRKGFVWYKMCKTFKQDSTAQIR